MNATNERNRRFTELLEPVYTDCQRWAYHLAQNYSDAEDILSQAVLSALASFHQLKNEDAFKTWMFRIIHNAFKLWLRSNKRQPDAVNPQDLSYKSPADEWTAHLQRTQLVRQLLGRLADDQREALVLFELQELSVKEAAQVLGKKETAVRVTLHRARARLKGLLEEAGVSPEGEG